MGLLYGLDCPNPQCIHDTARGYRLQLKVRRSRECWQCFRDGDAVSLDRWITLGGREATFPNDSYECKHCSQVWRNCWQMERTDLVFQKCDQAFAFGQMVQLGVADPKVGAFVVENHWSLPIGFDARMVILREEPLPRTCLYFEWQPEAGEKLTPDKVFQCAFRPDMGAAERATAARMTLPAELFNQLLRVPKAEGYVGESLIQCQHCGQRLPLRAFNTLTLRECTQGD